MTNDPIVELTGKIEQAIGALDQTLNPAVRRAERDAALADFQPGQKWAYASDEQRAEVADRVTAELDRRAGEGMFHVQRALLVDAGPQLEKLIAQQMEPPSPEEAWAQRTGRVGWTSHEMLGAETVDELRLQRHAKEFDTAQPSEVLERYEAALTDPSAQANATLIRFVENRFRAGRWVGSAVPADNDVEIAAVGALLRRIATARDGRLTPAAAKARQVMARGHQLHQSAKTLHKVRQLRPVGV